MNAYKFQPRDTGYEVILKGKSIGTIIPKQEPSGRHCFVLGCDTRDDARTYRGKILAAEALAAIDKLKQQSKKEKWSVESLIVNAWDGRPRASDQW